MIPERRWITICYLSVLVRGDRLITLVQIKRRLIR